jgi:hypothetical protein
MGEIRSRTDASNGVCSKGFPWSTTNTKHTETNTTATRKLLGEASAEGGRRKSSKNPELKKGKKSTRTTPQAAGCRRLQWVRSHSCFCGYQNATLPTVGVNYEARERVRCSPLWYCHVNKRTGHWCGVCIPMLLLLSHIHCANQGYKQDHPPKALNIFSIFNG